jgi:hypothetical protein
MDPFLEKFFPVVFRCKKLRPSEQLLQVQQRGHVGIHLLSVPGWPRLLPLCLAGDEELQPVS